MVWLPKGEKSLRICLLISTEYMNMTDRQTDRREDGQTPHDGIGYAYALHRAAITMTTTTTTKQEYRHSDKKLVRLLFDLASYRRCCQRNRRRLLTPSSDGRISLITVYNTCGATQRPSSSVDHSRGLMPSQNKTFLFETSISPPGGGRLRYVGIGR